MARRTNDGSGLITQYDISGNPYWSPDVPSPRPLRGGERGAQIVDRIVGGSVVPVETNPVDPYQRAFQAGPQSTKRRRGVSGPLAIGPLDMQKAVIAELKARDRIITTPGYGLVAPAKADAAVAAARKARDASVAHFNLGGPQHTRESDALTLGLLGRDAGVRAAPIPEARPAPAMARARADRITPSDMGIGSYMAFTDPSAGRSAPATAGGQALLDAALARSASNALPLRDLPLVMAGSHAPNAVKSRFTLAGEAGKLPSSQQDWFDANRAANRLGLTGSRRTAYIDEMARSSEANRRKLAETAAENDAERSRLELAGKNALDLTAQLGRNALAVQQEQNKALNLDAQQKLLDQQRKNLADMDAMAARVQDIITQGSKDSPVLVGVDPESGKPITAPAGVAAQMIELKRAETQNAAKLAYFDKQNELRLSALSRFFGNRYSGQDEIAIAQLDALWEMAGGDPATAPHRGGTGRAAPTVPAAQAATSPQGASGVPRRSPPPEAIDALRKDPSLKYQFDGWYGPGSADKVLAAS